MSGWQPPFCCLQHSASRTPLQSWAVSTTYAVPASHLHILAPEVQEPMSNNLAWISRAQHLRIKVSKYHSPTDCKDFKLSLDKGGWHTFRIFGDIKIFVVNDSKSFGDAEVWNSNESQTVAKTVQSGAVLPNWISHMFWILGCLYRNGCQAVVNWRT